MNKIESLQHEWINPEQRLSKIPTVHSPSLEFLESNHSIFFFPLALKNRLVVKDVSIVFAAQATETNCENFVPPSRA